MVFFDVVRWFFFDGFRWFFRGFAICFVCFDRFLLDVEGFDVGFRWVFVGAYASPAILMTDSCEGENVFSKRFLWMSFSTKCNAPRIGGNKNHPKKHREWCGRVWGVARLSKKHPKGISRKTSWIKLLGLLAVTCGTLAIVKV